MTVSGWDIDNLLKDKGISREEYDLMRKKAVDEYYKSIDGLKKERPLITKKMINKAKKKLKKLQKRQRKQDAQGVSNTADQWPHELVEKFLAEPREPYTPNMISEEKEKRLTHQEVVKESLRLLNTVKSFKITEEMMDAIRARYGITKDDKGNPLVDDVINAPVITERLDCSERPIVCDKPTRQEITMDEFIKFRDKMARPS